MNLIITSSRNFEDEASQEIYSFLETLGDSNPVIEVSDLSGILTATTSIDPFVVIKKIREKILEEPWMIRFCLRIIPVQQTVLTEIEDIVNAIIKLKTIMNPVDSYRITVEKRNSSISSSEIISKIAKKIANKVSLEDFTWNILIEILGKKTGISILKENDVLSTQKVKRSLSE